jgi:hypothetical protein
MRRLLPAACALWLVALFAAIPHAAIAPAAAGGAGAAAAHGGTLFTTSDNCMACHNNLVTPFGEDVSIGSTWRSSMMANSGRDPYFQAGLRREVIDHPTAAAEIQHECAACHMPMLQRTAHAAGQRADILAQLPIADSNAENHALAADGVSCTVCHQISRDGLGTRETFNGGFVMQATPASGTRAIFGPFKIDRGRTTIMRSVSGFEQSELAHIRESMVCSTCHTLYTEARGPDGRVIGELPEQMTFHEWDHTPATPDKRSCQSCHMPAVSESTRISSVMGDEREGLARHLFVGGNAFMLRTLNRFRTELGVAASSSELEATVRATLHQLETQTATVSIDRAELSGGSITVDVSVRNLTGHKLPTGYPSRRAWLHLSVRDQQGTTVFESGAVETTGLIRGNDGDRDPQRFEPHFDEIRSPDEVQIYESVMATPAGMPTTGLLQAVAYLKDNRLLPPGFDKTTAPPDIAVRGAAASDASFVGGDDRVRYLIDAGAATGPLQVDVELLYQPIGFRWAQNLRAYDAPEPRRFVSYFDALAAASSTVLARASAAAR